MDDDTPISLTGGVEKSRKLVKVGSHHDERQIEPCKSKVDIRNWRLGKEKLYPTKQGMRLHDVEFEKLMVLLLKFIGSSVSFLGKFERNEQQD